MKKIFIIAFLAAVSALVSCSDVKRKPGLIYMPDMAYSRAYETYAERDSNSFTTDLKEADQKIFYNNMPVPGTVARGEEMPFLLTKDITGDSTNYVASKQILNPLPLLDSIQSKEAERLYLIYCGICHGSKLDGNGPLYKDGQGPFPAAPKNLKTDPLTVNMPDGQMFYSVTYGKNLMGSYASQISRKQRWMIIHYIKAQQAIAKQTAAPAGNAAATK